MGKQTLTLKGEKEIEQEKKKEMYLDSGQP